MAVVIVAAWRAPTRRAAASSLLAASSHSSARATSPAVGIRLAGAGHITNYPARQACPGDDRCGPARNKRRNELGTSEEAAGRRGGGPRRRYATRVLTAAVISESAFFASAKYMLVFGLV